MLQINFEGHFKDLFDNTNDLIYFVNIDATLELVNSAWLTTLGYELFEVVGRPVYDFIHPDYLEEYKIRRDLIIKTGISNHFETAFATKKNDIIYSAGIYQSINLQVIVFTPGAYSKTLPPLKIHRKNYYRVTPG